MNVEEKELVLETFEGGKDIVVWVAPANNQQDVRLRFRVEGRGKAKGRTGFAACMVVGELISPD